MQSGQKGLSVLTISTIISFHRKNGSVQGGLYPFSISRDQQKLFIENFMQQALAAALDMTDKGRDKGSPGQTLLAVGQAIIAQLQRQATADGLDS